MWLECKTKAESGEGLGTEVKLWSAFLFSLKRLGFVFLDNGESLCGFEQRGHISMCDVLFDLEIRDFFLEEASVNLGLKGRTGGQPVEMAARPGQKKLWQQDVFRVHSGMN